MSEWSYVIAAYAFTWVGVVGYAVYVARRAARVREAWRWTFEEEPR